MADPAAILQRLDQIGQSLAQTGHALALLGLGSVGLERQRVDQYSDLDFFAIVEPGHKARYLETLDWLESIQPVVFRFRNSPDGYKLLFSDGIFTELAVFEPAELGQAGYAPARVVWQRPGVELDPAAATPSPGRGPAESPARPAEWLVNEALTNLYVGLGRYRRGEKLSAHRFVQVYALDRLVELAGRLEPEQPGWRDGFAPERRFEQRFPGLARRLSGFIGGYEYTPECALAILVFLEEHVEVNQPMAGEIRRLARGAAPSYLF